jgi:hypothetical protein
VNVDATVDEGRRKIASKIAKLLRRAEREDGPEADTARRMAERLMARHGVEVELHEFDQGPDPLIDERLVMVLRDRRRSMWSQFLLQQVAPLYWCTNKQQEVRAEDVIWMFYVVGPPGQIEPASIHFEYLRRKVQQIAKFVGSTLGRSPLDFPSARRGRRPTPYVTHDPRVIDGVHWGVMDGLLKNLERKRAAQPASPSVDDAREDTHTVVRLGQVLALLPAPEHLAVQGDEIAVCASGERPFGSGFEPPPDVSAPEPAYWAWQAGMEAVGLTDPEPPEVVYKAVCVLGVPDSVVEALRSTGVFTVAQLIRMRPSALLEINNVGELDVIELVHALGEHQLLLTPEWEDEMV